MQITIDTDRREIVRSDGTKIPLYSDEGFKAVADVWLKVAWNQKYSYTFSWLGAPIIQIPDDMIRTQEAICALKPDVIVETGVAHGGSLIFSASLCKLLGKGRVIGVDIEIRPPNRERLETHLMAPLITLFEGSSTDPAIVAQVKEAIGPAQTVLVILDSNHSYAHVMAELEAYAGFVTLGSYIVSTDGYMRELVDVPRGDPKWKTDNPANAAEDFVAKDTRFIIEEPAWPFNESTLRENVTHWPSAWIKRIA